MHRRIAIAAVLTVAVVASTARAQPGSAFPEASAEIQDLVRDAIADRFQAGDIPDISLLPDRAHVLLLKELRSANLQLSERALPSIRDTRFELMSAAAADAAAERTGRDLIYIAVDSPQVDRDTAAISLGVDFVPANTRSVKMCCCSGRAQFSKTAQRWTFVKWISITCS
jgi:hypothetical protein